MAWRLSAKKGNSVIRSGSKKRDIVRDYAKRLRKQGYKVSVYEVK